MAKTLKKSHEFFRGWFIGDFEPSMLKVKDFEAAIKFYKKGDKEEAHYHKVSSEFTVVGSGQFKMSDLVLSPGDIIQLDPGEVVDFECLQDGVTFVVKVPCAPDDKFIVEGPHGKES